MSLFIYLFGWGSGVGFSILLRMSQLLLSLIEEKRGGGKKKTQEK